MEGPDKGSADWQQQQELEEYMQWIDLNRDEQSKPKPAPTRQELTEGDCPF